MNNPVLTLTALTSLLVRASRIWLSQRVLYTRLTWLPTLMALLVLQPACEVPTSQDLNPVLTAANDELHHADTATTRTYETELICDTDASQPSVYTASEAHRTPAFTDTLHVLAPRNNAGPRLLSEVLMG